LNRRVRATVIKIKILVIIKRAIRVEASRGIIKLLEVYPNLIGVVL